MLDELTNAIHAKREKEETYILLLGAGCSVSSGCPPAKELTEKLIKDNKLGLDPNNSTLQDVEKNVGKAIFDLNVSDCFSTSWPSKGYWFCGELIKKGYFDLILTTNYDSCLEKALARTVGFDEFRVYIRGDADDDRIDELIKLNEPRIKIVKLHGDYQSRNTSVDPKVLWNLKPTLGKTLHNKIKERGIIIIGYSMHDSAILKILPQDTKQNFWYVGKSPPDNITKSILSPISIIDNHIIYGDQGTFDDFFTLQSMELAKADPSEKFFNDHYEQVMEKCNIQELDTFKLFADLDKLYTQIMKGKFKNLVFIHDPDAPGGSELLKLLEKRHPDILTKRNICKLQIEGRGKKKRQASKFEIIKKSSFDDSERYLLIDSVSFSGRTLELCRKYLIKKYGKSITVEAAVIYSGRPQEIKLSQKGYCFRNLFWKVEAVDAHQILFPWGLTQATDSIFAEEAKYNSINKYIPHKCFAFLPRPWGNILSLKENTQITVKILYLNPREMTSKHKHFCRNEIFFILDSRMILQVWDEHILLRKGCSFRIPEGTEHRLVGLDEPCRVLEISENYHNQIEDVFRLEDKYNRVEKKGDE